ncbi:adenylate kinase [Parafrankia sp. EAN1pec]|uniref:ATPase AAA n=1 Tax=Parafrankia sp. (strain EAN1pec) TaxID=298653 RepID=UPI000054236E|nr:adenylate kinase [Frankia sp. EAN1pec]
MMLSADDPLPGRPRRVLVAGTSGSGKTTLARRMAAVLDIPHIELDALHHGPAWTPRETFLADVDTFSAGPRWATEWQYSLVRGLLAERAELLVWLALPRRTVMRQVVRRTLLRRLRKEVLWNGNVEPPLRTIFTDREHVVRWAWSTHHKSTLRVAALRERRPELPIVRLDNHAAVERWCAGPLRAASRQ